MCLFHQLPPPQNIINSAIGYCVVVKVDRQLSNIPQDTYFSIMQNRKIPFYLGKQYIATNELIYDAECNEYEAGFHIFYTKEDAEAYRNSLLPSTSNRVICRVEVEHMWAYGLKYITLDCKTAVCGVYKYRRLLNEVA